MSDQDIVWFSEVDKNDTTLVGGKGANLGELYKLGIPIPNGFIVISQAYFDSLKNSGSLDRIKSILFDLNVDDPVQLESKAQACQAQIKQIQLKTQFEKRLFNYYRQLSAGKDAFVAVRSSATAEDLPEASFAGQQATFLNVQGKKNLEEALLGTWASLFEARAIFYRAQKNFDHFKVGIAVPIQKMIQSETSGVMFTVEPITNNKNLIIIEAIFGLGEFIVGGKITPDHYEIDKRNFKIVTKDIVSQKTQLVKAKDGNKEITIAKPYRNLQKLPDEKIVELARLGARIEKHYYFPQDIEWAYQDQKLYVVQTRPVTTLKQTKPKPDENQKEPSSAVILLRGAPASPQIGTGRAIIIKSPKELYKIQKGDVLVTTMTNPDFVPAMRKAAAIITDRGGRTSHAAIVSRELGIACVVGTGEATKKLKDGMVVTVDGTKGLVLKGQLVKQKTSVELSPKPQVKVRKTATKLYVNLAEPELTTPVATKNVDGVGLLRAEFILAQIGKHPKRFIEEKRGQDFITRLAENLAIFGKAFGKRPVIYRATDLKSSEYRNLSGGERYEPKEANPMLGYRGAFRYIKDPDVFKLELEAIKQVRQRHPNLHLMIPFVRNVKELQMVRSIVEEAGLFADKSFQFWMMVEIPTNVIRLDEFIKVGIDGVSIGSNDLTMLILGVDRDNEEIAGEFNELDPAVLWALEKTVKTATRANIACSICGQAPSVYPELTTLLVSWGITSISINPDAIETTREYIYQAEQKLIAQKTRKSDGKN